MQRILILAGAALISASALGSHPQPQPRQLDKASVLPLALDDHFQFRKTEILLADCADSLSALAHGRVSRSFGVRCACPERSRRILAALLTRVAASWFRNP